MSNLEESKPTKQIRRIFPHPLVQGATIASSCLGIYIYILVLHEPAGGGLQERALCSALVAGLSAAIGQFVAQRLIDLKDGQD